MHASTASMCFRSPSDCTNSHTNCQAVSRSISLVVADHNQISHSAQPSDIDMEGTPSSPFPYKKPGWILFPAGLLSSEKRYTQEPQPHQKDRPGLRNRIVSRRVTL